MNEENTMPNDEQGNYEHEEWEGWVVEGYFGPDGHADTRYCSTEKAAQAMAARHHGIYYPG